MFENRSSLANFSPFEPHFMNLNHVFKIKRGIQLFKKSMQKGPEFTNMHSNAHDCTSIVMQNACCMFMFFLYNLNV
jgi:hypothetical protein